MITSLFVSLEEDFVSWREQFWPAVCEHFGVEASGDELRCVSETSEGFCLLCYLAD